MAKQKDMQIVGTYDDIIFYKSKGVHLFRKKGNTGNQAPVAKQQASIMGKASAISAKLRGPLKPLIPEAAARRLMYRLNNSLQQWLRTKPEEVHGRVENISMLNGFPFEEHNAIIEMFHAALPVISSPDSSLFISIPSFDSPNPISPLPFSGRIDIKAIAVSCNIQNPSDTVSHETGFVIDYDGTPVPAQELHLDIKPRAGYLTVVAVSVNNMVAGIVRAMYN
jgi:hypothetical protein